jgi:hypothetical protein
MHAPGASPHLRPNARVTPVASDDTDRLGARTTIAKHGAKTGAGVKSHVLFVAVPFQGHLRPAVAVASALASKGIGVSFAGGEQSRDIIESAGLSFVSLGHIDEAFSKEMIRQLSRQGGVHVRTQADRSASLWAGELDAWERRGIMDAGAAWIKGGAAWHPASSSQLTPRPRSRCRGPILLRSHSLAPHPVRLPAGAPLRLLRGAARPRGKRQRPHGMLPCHHT